MSARNKVTLLLLALLFFLQAIGQKNVNSLNHPDRYRLDLPKEWNKHKLIEAITDILPQTIDELKDREFCTEDFLLNICEQKIFEIRRLLKKINSD